jgi:hypothetical protein
MRARATARQASRDDICAASVGCASPLFESGAVAQLGERELCKLEVVGSIPIGSTNLRCAAEVVLRSLGDGGRLG